MNKILLVLCCFTFTLLLLPSSVGAQFAESDCVVTKIGVPQGSPPPLPPGCIGENTGSRGIYRFPLESADTVTAISTEMASYAGTYSFMGHIEHAGLDIGTPYEKKVPVYAVADGKVIQSATLGTFCINIVAGCTVKIQHTRDPNEFTSIYTHVDPLVKVGQEVQKGMKIGVVHDWLFTANMDHLHFELKRQDNNWNVNPRNYFPEFQRFPASPFYTPNVRDHSARRQIYLLNDGKEWAENFQNHPPCKPGILCWAL